MLKPGTSEHFILAAVGVRDISRRPLAEALIAIKKKHFGADVFERDWSTSEIKGSYLNHAMVHALKARVMAAPSAYRALDTVEKTEAFIADLGMLFREYAPVVVVHAVEKAPLLADVHARDPLGIAYTRLHESIARVLADSNSDDAALVVADEQKEHEKYFSSGDFARARDAAAAPGIDWRSIMDKPLWIDPKLSSWDREIIQLADIVVFAASRFTARGEAPEEPQFLWDQIAPLLKFSTLRGI